MNIAPDLVTLAHQFLQENNLPAATTCLQAALSENPSNLEAHNLREHYQLTGALGSAFNMNAVISPDDDIFRFFANHPSSLHPIRDYLADGWRTLAELTQLLARLERNLHTCSHFLEFACGFGRFTRHLVSALPTNTLHVSDVVPGSVDFLRSQFNVSGFYSSTDPATVSFPPQQHYDIIFVLSLFSHLPDSTWQAWLTRLFSVVKPGGVLIITTHGEKCATQAGVTLTDGYAFFPDSESHALSHDVYGCTFTTPEYVDRTISTLAERRSVHHFPAHFWGNQDAYAISRRT